MLYSLHPNFYLNCLLFQVKCRISQEAENSMRIQLQMQNSCSSQIAFFFPKWNQNLRWAKIHFSTFFVFWYILSLVVSVMQHWISLGCHTCVTTQKLSHKMPKSTNVCPSKKAQLKNVHLCKRSYMESIQFTSMIKVNGT